MNILSVYSKIQLKIEKVEKELKRSFLSRTVPSLSSRAVGEGSESVEKSKSDKNTKGAGNNAFRSLTPLSLRFGMTKMAIWKAAEKCFLKLQLFFWKTLKTIIRFFALLFNDGSKNYLIFTKFNKDSVVVCNNSFCQYKKFQKRVRFYSKTAFAGILVATIITTSVLYLFMPGKPTSFAATFDWIQSTWIGGASTDVANHTDNKTNWTKFYSKDANVIAGTDLTLSQTTETTTETTDADFNAGTKDTVYVSGNSVYLLKPLGASCAANAECESGSYCSTSSGVCMLPPAGYILGICSGILVYESNVSGKKKWKTSNTACDTPQCGTDGGQNGDNLVADNSVDFSLYPARNACKDLDGRLPTRTELSCIYTNKSEYGDNFVASYYWSSTEYHTTYAWHQNFSNGTQTIYNKTLDYYVRCVRGW